MPPGVFHAVLTLGERNALGPCQTIGTHYIPYATLAQTLLARISHACWHSEWSNHVHDDYDVKYANMITAILAGAPPEQEEYDLTRYLTSACVPPRQQLFALLYICLHSRTLQSLPDEVFKGPPFTEPPLTSHSVHDSFGKRLIGATHNLIREEMQKRAANLVAFLPHSMHSEWLRFETHHHRLLEYTLLHKISYVKGQGAGVSKRAKVVGEGEEDEQEDEPQQEEDEDEDEEPQQDEPQEEEDEEEDDQDRAVSRSSSSLSPLPDVRQKRARSDSSSVGSSRLRKRQAV